MGFDYEEKLSYFGECKWRNELVESSVLETLVYRADIFSYPSKELYLFLNLGSQKR